MVRSAIGANIASRHRPRASPCRTPIGDLLGLRRFVRRIRDGRPLHAGAIGLTPIVELPARHAASLADAVRVERMAVL